MIKKKQDSSCLGLAEKDAGMELLVRGISLPQNHTDIRRVYLHDELVPGIWDHRNGLRVEVRRGHHLPVITFEMVVEAGKAQNALELFACRWSGLLCSSTHTLEDQARAVPPRKVRDEEWNAHLSALTNNLLSSRRQRTRRRC